LGLTFQASPEIQTYFDLMKKCALENVFGKTSFYHILVKLVQEKLVVPFRQSISKQLQTNFKIFLGFQAFLFYFPHAIFKSWEGGKIRSIISGISMFQSSIIKIDQYSSFESVDFTSL